MADRTKADSRSGPEGASHSPADVLTALITYPPSKTTRVFGRIRTWDT